MVLYSGDVLQLETNWYFYPELIPALGTLLVSTLCRELHCSVHTGSAQTPSILSEALHFPSRQYIEHHHTTILGTYSVWFLITWGIYKANPQPKVGRQSAVGSVFATSTRYFNGSGFSGIPSTPLWPSGILLPFSMSNIAHLRPHYATRCVPDNSLLSLSPLPSIIKYKPTGCGWHGWDMPSMFRQLLVNQTPDMRHETCLYSKHLDRRSSHVGFPASWSDEIADPYISTCTWIGVFLYTVLCTLYPKTITTTK